jgi:hypothetical protein
MKSVEFSTVLLAIKIELLVIAEHESADGSDFINGLLVCTLQAHLV